MDKSDHMTDNPLADGPKNGRKSYLPRPGPLHSEEFYPTHLLGLQIISQKTSDLPW
jgi:hypothetical protein